MTLEEIRAMKNSGKIKPMKPLAPEYNLPDEFWDKAEFKESKK